MFRKYINITLIVILVLVLSLTGCSKETENNQPEQKVEQKQPEEKIVIKMNSSQSKGTTAVDGAYLFKEIVEGKMGDKVEIQVFPEGQLGTDVAILEGMRMGTHDALVVATPITTVDGRFSLFDLPYLLTSREEVEKITKGPLGKELSDGLEEKGFHNLGFWHAGWRNVTNNIRAIENPEDLKGLKIRVPSSPSRVALFKILGANPTPMSFGELFSALQQGVVDGQENPIMVLTSSSLMEVQKYLSFTKHVYAQYYILFSKQIWDSYPEDVKKALTEASDQVAEKSWEMEKVISDNTMQAIEGKMEINEVNMDAFKEAAKSIYEDPKFVEPIGKELLDKALETLGRK